MARPIKNNADYFPHDADMRNDPRIKALRRKFNLEGYAIYSMLLEFLTDSDYFEFKNDNLSLELVAGDFDIETDKLTSILQYCFQLGLFQLDAITNIISCKSLDNRLEPLLSKRKRDRNEVIADDNTQSRVEESKVKKRKEKEKKADDNITATKVATIEERQLGLMDDLKPFVEKYGKEMLREFFDYWTEKNKNGKKMRFEMQKVFDISLRLATWNKNKSNGKFTDKRQQGINTLANNLANRVMQRNSGGAVGASE
jgi:hypothetical protein